MVAKSLVLLAVFLSASFSATCPNADTRIHMNETVQSAEQLRLAGAVELLTRLENCMSCCSLWTLVDCKSIGMELVSIQTPEEEELIINAIKAKKPVGGPYNGYWTSGTKLTDIQSTHFYWLSTGTRVVHSNFAKGQPDNAGKSEHCLQLFFDSNGNAAYWNDINCKTDLSFVCQKVECNTKSENCQPMAV
ncbi:perlucin-like isoform X2 [Cylas formicarius]|uniref:perlucin-like isoform X2 n=2 Tax=Cylas formicarius TaxID=197179 RepID=UPI0029583762|nr:perlucin-like isoform X2 [Cylas formicarius]